MLKKIPYIVRLAYLLLYAVYALTPVQMYGMSGRGPAHAEKHVSTDIVWVNVLFSSPDDDGEVPSAGSLVAGGAQQGGDVVLVQKRRALFREQFDIQPLFAIKLLPAVHLAYLSAWPPAYEIAKDPLSRETDGCLTLTSGLSPPSLLS